MISFSSACHAAACSSAGSANTSLIFLSTSGSLNADSLVPNPTSSMSVDWRSGGIQRGARRPVRAPAVGADVDVVLGSSRSAEYFASVVGDRGRLEAGRLETP